MHARGVSEHGVVVRQRGPGPALWGRMRDQHDEHPAGRRTGRPAGRCYQHDRDDYGAHYEHPSRDRADHAAGPARRATIADTHWMVLPVRTDGRLDVAVAVARPAVVVAVVIAAVVLRDRAVSGRRSAVSSRRRRG